MTQTQILVEMINDWDMGDSKNLIRCVEIKTLQRFPDENVDFIVDGDRQNFTN